MLDIKLEGNVDEHVWERVAQLWKKLKQRILKVVRKMCGTCKVINYKKETSWGND